MQFTYLGGFLLLLVSLSACANQSSADEITKDLQTVKSWAATTHMVSDAWIRGVVPTPYAKETLQKGQEELQKEADSLAKKPHSQKTATLLEHLQHVQKMMSQMSRAVEQKDRPGMTQQIKQLSTEEQAISALAKSADGQP